MLAEQLENAMQQTQAADTRPDSAFALYWGSKYPMPEYTQPKPQPPALRCLTGRISPGALLYETGAGYFRICKPISGQSADTMVLEYSDASGRPTGKRKAVFARSVKSPAFYAVVETEPDRLSMLFSPVLVICLLLDALWQSFARKRPVSHDQGQVGHGSYLWDFVALCVCLGVVAGIVKLVKAL